MTGRERVLRVLNREQADTIPFDIGGTDCSSVHVIPYAKLRALLGLPARTVSCGCFVQLIAKTDRDVMDALDVDAEALFFGSRATKVWKSPFGVELEVPELFGVQDLPDGSSIVRNAAGSITGARAANAYYFDPVGAPLADVQAEADLKRFDALFERWDYPAVYDEPLDALGARARAQYAATTRAVVTLWRMHYLQAGQIMRGYEQFFVDMMTDLDLTHAILRKLHEVYLRRVRAFMAAFGDAFDIAFLTDDLGTQQTGLISPKLYREVFFPYMAELVRAIKAYGKKVIMHSCGAVSEFVPDLIEMGVDALNPVQVAAGGMNPRDLVRRFGRDIAFWGGGCDTQHALNSRDPEVVRADVVRRLDEFGPDAHLVFTQVHNIQYDVPAPNILAMRDAFWKTARR